MYIKNLRSKSDYSRVAAHKRTQNIDEHGTRPREIEIHAAKMTSDKIPR
jgi:hypothetical protein